MLNIYHKRGIFMLVRIINGDNKVVTPPGGATICIENQYFVFISRFKRRRTFTQGINGV